MAARAINLALVLVLLGGTPAVAQVAAIVTLQSDERYRGRSLSRGEPVASLGVSYDHVGGAYVGGTTTTVLSGEHGPGLLSANAYAGYARRIDGGPVVDVGITGFDYTRRYLNNRDDTYIEAYAGISKAGVSAYVRLAPSYFGGGAPVLYVEAAAVRTLAPGWRLNAGLGVAMRTNDRPGLGGRDARYDGRLGLTRELEDVEVRAQVTFGGPDDDYWDGPAGGRTALVLSISRGF